MENGFEPRELTREQQQELHRQAVLQAEVTVENARKTYLMALAALKALIEDGVGQKLVEADS